MLKATSVMIPTRKGHAHFQVDKTGHEMLQDFLPLKSLIPSGSFWASFDHHTCNHFVTKPPDRDLNPQGALVGVSP